MKAWRNIQGNNGKRPTQRTKIYGGSTLLLDGLLIRGGFLDPLPALERRYFEPYAPSPLPWWHKAMNKVKALFR